jgi:hypothetical protein
MAKKGITIRFEESMLEFCRQNSYNVQSLVTRLMDKYKAEKETEQQKISNYQK